MSQCSKVRLAGSPACQSLMTVTFAGTVFLNLRMILIHLDDLLFS
jgi:hypothetical protein